MRTRLEIKRVDLWSLFKLSFLLYAACGLIVGLFYGFFLVLASALDLMANVDFPELGMFTGILGVLVVPMMVLFYGAFGSVTTTITGAFYNMFASMAGGLKIDVDVDMPEPVHEVLPPIDSVPTPDETGPTI